MRPGAPIGVAAQLETAGRFWPKVKQRAPNECWPWLAGLDPQGYGQFNVAGRLVRSHRFAYEYVLGPIPDGLDLDHLCRNRSCVNPLHLEPVTRRVNLVRGAQAIKECPKGHPYADGEPRKCRVCDRERGMAYYRRTSTRGPHNRAKTHCPQGHPYDEVNTYALGNQRWCRLCTNQRGREYRARKRADYEGELLGVVRP